MGHNDRNENQNKFRIRQGWFLLGGLIAGFVVGQLHRGEPAVHADVRQTTTRSTLQAGSERSESILKEIAGTLKTIDGRLERVEKFIARKDAAK